MSSLSLNIGNKRFQLLTLLSQNHTLKFRDKIGPEGAEVPGIYTLMQDRIAGGISEGNLAAVIKRLRDDEMINKSRFGNYFITDIGKEALSMVETVTENNNETFPEAVISQKPSFESIEQKYFELSGKEFTQLQASELLFVLAEENWREDLDAWYKAHWPENDDSEFFLENEVMEVERPERATF